MRYIIFVLLIFVSLGSYSQGGKLIKIKVNKGETGATGAAGDDGREVELQNSGTFIQWRYVGDVSWTNLIDIDDITGPTGADGIDGADGTEIELQNSGTYIQWRYVGAGSWTNLIAISAITGADGSDGADGVDGSTWYEGTGAPSSGLGANGDFYLNDANGDVYTKTGGTWAVVANIKGADGVGAGTVTSAALTTGTSGTDINVTGSPITSSGTFTLNVPSSSASNRGLLTSTDWSTFNSKIGGSGTASRLPYFSGTSTLANTSLYWDNINIRLGIGAAPNYPLHVAGMALISGLDADITPSPTPYGATKMVIVDSDGLLNTQAIPTSGISGSGATNYMTFWNTSSTISNTDISYGASWGDTGLGFGVAPASVAANIDLATGKTLRFQGTSTIVDKNNSGGSASQIFARAASGGGVDWQSPSELALENALTFNSPLSRSTNTISIPAATTSVSGHLTSTDWNTFNNKVGGSGTATRLAFWSGTSTLSSNANLYWDNTNSRLGIGTVYPSRQLTTTQDISANGNDIGLGGGNQPNNARFGNAALNNNTTGVGNLAIGAYALLNNTTGYYNIALGNQAMFYNVSGHTNTAIGQNTLVNNTGSKNTGIGTEALYSLTSGVENTAISALALRSNVTGNSNIAIGYGAGYSETGSGKLYIEPSTSSTPLIGGDFSTDRVGINVAIGSISRTLHVGGEVRINDLVTDTPTSWVGSDGDGDLANGSVGNGIALASGALGLTGQALAVHNLGTNGLIALTSSGNVSARTITAGNGIAVTNGDGVSGNPTVVAESSQYGQLFGNGQYSISETGTYTLFSSYADASDDGSGSFTTNTGTGRITCNFTGTVKVSLTGYFINDTNDGGNTNLGLFKNASTGTFYSIIQCQNVVANTSYGQGFHGFILNVTSGDYFDTRYTNSITNQTVNQSLFLVQRIN